MSLFPSSSALRRRGALLCVLAGALALGAGAQAQVQEKRIEQILKPDTTRAFDLRQSSVSGKKFSTPDTPLPVKASPVLRKFDARSYLTGAFHANKTYWAGDFQFAASNKSASTRGGNIATASYPIRSLPFPVQALSDKGAYFEANKEFSARAHESKAWEKTREKLLRQLTPEEAANVGYKGDFHELKTIDDIRALLNKSKW